MKHQGGRDVPVAMPRRQLSSSQFLKSVSNRLLQPSTFSNKKSSSRLSILYSPESSIKVLNSCMKDDLQRNGDFRFLSSGELRPSDSSREVKNVRFAPPSQVNSTFAVIGLGEYTIEEYGACWYSQDDIEDMRQRCRREDSKRRLFKKKKVIRCPLLNKIDKRWSV